MNDNILIQLNSEQIDAIIRGLNLLRTSTYEDITSGITRESPIMQEKISILDNLIYYLKLRLNINYENKRI